MSIENVPEKAVEILLVEDNPGDIRLMEETFKESKVVNNLSIVNDGVEALAFLRRQEGYSHAPRPDLIILDLNLPKKDGRELLTEIKQDPKIKHIPVIVLTTSKADEDVLRAYQLYANCYIPKPFDFEQFTVIMKGVEDFWLTIVKLPPK